MVYLYLNNFRGFSNTTIKLKDVNFLVGENSTGKTSILALIEIFNNSNFWIKEVFRSVNTELGDFDDIVSAFAIDRSFFDVGFLKTDTKRENGYYGFIFSFIKRENMPFCRGFTYITDNILITNLFKGTQVYYQYQIPGKFDINNEEEVKKLFLEMSKKNAEGKIKGYKVLKNRLGSRTENIKVMSILTELITEKNLRKYSDDFDIEKLMTPFGDINWLAPIRMEPERTYDKRTIEYDPKGAHAPYLLNKIIRHKKLGGKLREYLKYFGENSNLFDSIDTKRYAGSGIPFEVDVLLNGKRLNLINVGYGVSQVMPLLLDIFACTSQSSFLMQQPEIHLHPKGQAAIGDLIFMAAQYHKNSFVVETHSEFIIDRYRIAYRKNSEEKKPSSQIVYFSRDIEGNKLETIEILNNGELSAEQSPGYMEFFIKEELEVLDL